MGQAQATDEELMWAVLKPEASCEKLWEIGGPLHATTNRKMWDVVEPHPTKGKLLWGVAAPHPSKIMETYCGAGTSYS